MTLKSKPVRILRIQMVNTLMIQVLLAVILVSSVNADDASTNDEVNLSSNQIAQLRKFRVINQYVTSEDGYIINLVYIPAVKKTNKRPVIFNHGTTQSSTYFMTNSVGARPKDFSALDAGSMSQSELEQLLANEPVTKCMPLLLVCLGHDVWLVNRRGTEFSLGKVNRPRKSGNTTNILSSDGLTSRLSHIKDTIMSSIFSRTGKLGRDARDDNDNNVRDSTSSGLLGFLEILLRPQLNLRSIANTLDPRYWNFSLDEQAIYDLPAIINHVRNYTGSQKVAYIGHSIGNVLMFMLQSEQPEWADVVEPFLAWSPDIYLSHSTSLAIPLFVTLQPILMYTAMPFPPTPIDPLTRTLLAALCQTKLTQDTVCRALENGLWGESGDQQETLPAFVASQFYSASSHEITQLAQAFEKGALYKYDFGISEINENYYDQAKPPRYNVSRIRSKSISLWHGEKDALADPTDVQLFIDDLTVSVDDRFITEVPFNHYCLLFGRNVTTLVNIPSLMVVESYK